MWVVRLQRQLLEAICDVSVCGTHVTEPWVITQLPQLDHQWVTGLCQSYKSKQKPRMTLLAYMEAMADYPPAVKTELLEAFKHDLQVLEDLERGVRPGRTMRGIQAIGNKQQQKEIRAFFELFYEPNFDKGKGYPTTTIGNQPVNFDRSHFVEQFKDENTFTAVCPLCDGQRGIAQVDHFYPKSRYPFLSCHPLNLIPICKDCNMAPCKGEKPPIAHRAQTNQMEEWFHPVLEPLADWTDSATHPNSSQFRIEFKRKNGPTAPVPASDDRRTTKRLENLDKLIRINSRWHDELKNQYMAAIRIIQSYRRERKQGMTEQELVRRLELWAEEAKSKIGIEIHCILKHFYFKEAAQRDTKLFLELWIENTDGDPFLSLLRLIQAFSRDSSGFSRRSIT